LRRVRFDISLTNAIRRVRCRGEGAEPSQANISVISAAPPPQERGAQPAHSVTNSVTNRPAKIFRRLLGKDIRQKINQAQRTLETIQQKIDLAQWTLEKLGATLDAFGSDPSRHTVALAAGVDAVEKRLAPRVEAVETRFAARIDAVETRLEELALRVRQPIEVDDSTMAVRTADGFVLVPRSDTTLLLMLCDAGPQGLEPGTRRLLTRLLLPGMMFVDVGAHIGLLTLAGARAVGPQGRVVALEPTPITFDLLIRALAISGLGDLVEAQRLACGALPERRAFHVATVLGHSSLLEPATVGSDRGVQWIEVDVVRLDDVLPTGARVDVVKIDVEGAELDVLAGMTRILRENPDLAIIAEFGPAHLRRAQITPDAWFEAFHMHGLEAYAIDELSGECNRVRHQDLTAIESVNILFCRTNSRAAAHARS
jgi:FkbM family methyltransferase